MAAGRGGKDGIRPQVGQYLLGDRLGRGAFGDVFKGLDTETGKFVAVKQVSLQKLPSAQRREVRNEMQRSGGDSPRSSDADDSDSRNRAEKLLPASVLHEVNLLKRLEHKHIVRYLNTVVSSTHLSLVLEFIESGSLAQVLERFGVFPEKLTGNYVRQVLSGLRFLHGQKTPIAHLDIKAGNLLITKEGIIKLADFGISAVVRGDDDTAPVETVEGSPFWMAPEVIQMEAIGCVADIWSLGCTIIELITGFPPYYDTNGVTAMFKMVEDLHPPLPPDEDASNLCRVFLLECFNKDPAKRPSAQTLTRHPWMKALKPDQAPRDYTGTLTRVQQFNTMRQKATMRSLRGGSIVGFFDANASGTSVDAQDSRKESNLDSVFVESNQRLPGKLDQPASPSVGLKRRHARNGRSLVKTTLPLDETLPAHAADDPLVRTVSPRASSNLVEQDMVPTATPEAYSNTKPDVFLVRTTNREIIQPDPQQDDAWHYTALVTNWMKQRNFIYSYTLFIIKVMVSFPKEKAGMWEIERSYGDFKAFDAQLHEALRLQRASERSKQRTAQGISKAAVVNLPGSGRESALSNERVVRTGVVMDDIPSVPRVGFFGNTDDAFQEQLGHKLRQYLGRLLQLPAICKHPLLLHFLDLSPDGEELI